MHPLTPSIDQNNWRYQFARALLLLAAVPVQIYAVPGFEITPSLILAAFVFVLFQPEEKIHYFVIGFLGFCGLIALAGMVGGDGKLRNLIGAASFSSGIPYVMIGIVFAQQKIDLAKVWQPVAAAAMLVTAIFAVDLYFTGGNLIQSSMYKSTSYYAPETVFVNSIFPFYGKYAVITLATISMMLAGLAIASTASYRGNTKYYVLLASSFLMFISFTTWTRQVMLGVLIFYAVLIILSFRRKETWISAGVFLFLAAVWGYGFHGNSLDNFSALEHSEMSSEEHVVGARGIGEHKFGRSLDAIESGNFDQLSTGRLPLYRDAISRITPRIVLAGCGFCNLKDVMKFPFSSLHNVALTAVYKGGLLYAALYIGIAFSGLFLMWRSERSFARDATMATIASIAFQSLVNDVLYFQVVPALLFALSGYLIAEQILVRNRERGGGKPDLLNALT